MSKPSTTTLLYGAILGGLVGALLGAVMASRSADREGRAGKRPTAKEATAIGITALGLVKQLLDAFV